MSKPSDLSAFFEAIYNEHFDKLYRYGYSLVREKSMAEDIVADVFESLWLKRDQLHEINNIRAYMLRSVKNLSLQKLEKKKSSGTSELYSQDILLSNTDPELILEGNELEKVIENLYHELTPHGKLVYDMTRNKGLDKEEIAKELGITTRAVNKHLRKVQNHFRSALNQYFQKGDAYFYISKMGAILIPISSISFLYFQ